MTEEPVPASPDTAAHTSSSSADQPATPDPSADQPAQSGLPAAGIPTQPGAELPTGYLGAPGYPVPPVQAIPAGYPMPPGYPGLPVRRRHTGLIAGLIVLVLLVVAAAGGFTAYVLTRDNSRGQASPTAAVAGFLDAIYTRHDAVKATRYVCPTSRDLKKITAKVNDIKQRDLGYTSPVYTWTPPKREHTTKDQVILTTTVTLLTSLEQQATQSLRFTTTRHNGWWVCEVQPAN